MRAMSIIDYRYVCNVVEYQKNTNTRIQVISFFLLMIVKNEILITLYNN
jgi:hypothetical protein